jgi:hypothetical protein
MISRLANTCPNHEYIFEHFTFLGNSGDKIISHLLNLKLGASPGATTRSWNQVWSFTPSGFTISIVSPLLQTFYLVSINSLTSDRCSKIPLMPNLFFYFGNYVARSGPACVRTTRPISLSIDDDLRRKGTTKKQTVLKSALEVGGESTSQQWDGAHGGGMRATGWAWIWWWDKENM